MATYQVATPSMDMAHQILVSHGLDSHYFCQRNTLGDGNCFFHALADQLRDVEIKATVAPRARFIPLDHLILRQRIVDFARQEGLQDEDILHVLQLEESDERKTKPPAQRRDMFKIWSDYLDGMRLPRIFASEKIIRMAAKFFAKDIRVIREDSDFPWYGGQQASAPQMVIVHMHGNHFQSVHRRQRENAPTGGLSQQQGLTTPTSQPPRRTLRSMTKAAAGGPSLGSEADPKRHITPPMSPTSKRTDERLTPPGKRTGSTTQRPPTPGLSKKMSSLARPSSGAVTKRQITPPESPCSKQRDEKSTPPGQKAGSTSHRPPTPGLSKKMSQLAKPSSARRVLSYSPAPTSSTEPTPPKSKQHQPPQGKCAEPSPDILSKPCRNCKRDDLRSLMSHLAKKPECKAKYSCAELDEAVKKRIAHSKKAHYNDNREKVLQSRKEHYAVKREDILESKKGHYTEKREDILESRKGHYTEKREDILESRKGHYTEKREDILKSKKGHYRLQKNIRFRNSSEKERFEKFQDDIKDGWAFACISCHRLFFKKGVEMARLCLLKGSHKTDASKLSGGSIEVQLDKLKDRMEEIKVGLFSTCIDRNAVLTTEGLFYKNTLWLCLTCIKYIKGGKQPRLCSLNGLQAEPIPKVLVLNDLETCLVAKKILFMKIFQLPRSRWNAVVDKTINIPILDDDILQTLNTIQSLPRKPDQAGLVPVQLKRKLEYKNKVVEAYIDPDKLVAAVRMLQKLGHPSYQGIDINQNFIAEVQSAAKSEGGLDTYSDEDECDDALSEVEEGGEISTFMTEKYPESGLVLNQGKTVMQKKRRSTSREAFPIAPGEGKVPTSLMRDKTWDIDAFPTLHPSGKYGFHYPRPQKLKAKDYFMQRLENVDGRWRNNKPWVFAALNYLEREQLEGQIRISYQRGKKVGGTLVNPENVFSVFDRIPGTQRYWQQKRYEVVARLENLGCFHLFFTLSCADQRWVENFTSILGQRNLNISFEKAVPISEGILSYMPDKVLVNGVPIDEYLANHSLSQLVRENILTVSRNFDHRVDCFIKRIVMNNKTMHAKFFNYRVEFQMRGAGHVHGVLWLNMDQLERTIPGIIEVFTKLNNGQLLSSKEHKVAAIFIDSFITCSTDNEVRGIVTEVQYHKHSKSCRKHGNFCRFGYPRYPSDETIVAQPLDKTKFPSEKALKDELKRLREILSKVKEVLESYDGLVSTGMTKEELLDLLEDVTLDDILDQAGVSKLSYNKALSISVKGTCVVLKRRPSEMNINNYNPEWIKAWNGNMDLQVCLDSFAVSTYITDYYTKDESGTTKFLMEAAKECRGKERSEQLHYMVNTFLTHRQMGESEAHYRMLPHMHLSESNIGCVFLASGEPQDRSRIVYRVREPDKLIEEEEDEDELGESSCSQSSLIQIPGREGYYREAPSKIDKYENRPDYLNPMCLAQFVKCFDTISVKEGKKRDYQNGMSFSKSE